MRGSVLAAGLLAGAGLYAVRLELAPLLTLPLIIGGQLGRQRPAFLVDGRTFSAVFTRWSVVALAGATALTMGMIGSLRGEQRHPAAVPLVSFAVLLAFLLLAGVSVVWRLPGVVLIPDGIIRRSLFRTRFTRWGELSGPAVFRPWDSALKVQINGQKKRVFPGRLETDHRFIADAVEYYRVHPEHRAAIGTMEEHLRLDAALRERYEVYLRWRRAVYGR